MSPKELTVACPTCGKRVVRRGPKDPPSFPFCSERCRLLDLGKWLDAEHRISEDLPQRKGDAEPEEDGAAGGHVSG